jgi:hypothetical protein
MSSDCDEMITVCVSMLRRDFNRLTHMMSEPDFKIALMEAACEQISNYRSKVDPRGDHPYRVISPIDPG